MVNLRVTLLIFLLMPFGLFAQDLNQSLSQQEKDSLAVLSIDQPKDTPLEYAKTVSNKANALRNLPDDLLQPEKGNLSNLLQAGKYYQSALEIFTQYQQTEQVEFLADTLQEITQEIKSQEKLNR